MTQTAGPSLWRASGAWRLVVVLAGTFLGLGLLGAPWRTQQSVGSTRTASYTSSTPTSTAAPSVPGSPVVSPGSSGTTPSGAQSDHLELPNQPAVAAAAPSAAIPVTSSGVVWSSGAARPPGPTVSGGGLILSYCCAGAMATGYASRGVTSGQHYWELTLSTQPGEPTPKTWTAAGIVAAQGTPSAHRLARPGGGAGQLYVEVGRGKTFRGGDVLMFALDADRRIGYWGVNGQWRNGVPGTGDGTPLALGPGEQFLASGTLSAADHGSPEGDRWVANFGNSPFKYPVPAGYNPYAGSGYWAAMSATAQGTSSARSPASLPAPSDALIGKVIEGQVTVSGETVPLPDGRWMVFAHFRGNGARPGDAVLLGQVQGRTLRRMVAVHANRGARSASEAAPRTCLRQDVYFQSNKDGRMDAPRCWWVNHATALWEQQGLFRAARAEMDQRGLQVPNVFVNVGFYRSDAEGFANAFYYFDPGEQGISSQPYLWSESEWHKSRIDADPPRAAYARKLVEWGRNWEPIYFASR